MVIGYEARYKFATKVVIGHYFTITLACLVSEFCISGSTNNHYILFGECLMKIFGVLLRYLWYRPFGVFLIGSHII